MKKLVGGILEFRRNLRPGYRENFARLALGQSPDALFIACCDSRVAVNVFASTNPGDLFVVRNVGNMVPPCGCEKGHSSADESEAAAIEFALLSLNVSDIIICGHSECGAMQALVSGREKIPSPNLREWLRHGDVALTRLSSQDSSLAPHNRLSQINVLQQIEHLKTYPVVRDRIAENKLRLHAWWFDLHTADVYAFDAERKEFSLFNDEMAKRIIEES